jgi:hypothetical protein
MINDGMKKENPNFQLTLDTDDPNSISNFLSLGTSLVQISTSKTAPVLSFILQQIHPFSPS